MLSISHIYISDRTPNDCYCFLIKLILLSHKITAEIIIPIAKIAAAFYQNKRKVGIDWQSYQFFHNKQEQEQKKL